MIRCFAGTTTTLGFEFRLDNKFVDVATPIADIYDFTRTKINTLNLSRTAIGRYSGNYYINPTISTGSYFSLATGTTNAQLVISDVVPFEVLDMQVETFHVSLSEVKNYLGIEIYDYDDLLRAILRAASQHVETYCRRSFKLSTVTERFEVYYDKGLQLKEYPVHIVVGTTITSESRTFDLSYSMNSGGVNFVDSDGFQIEVEYGLIDITYKAGYTSTPEPVRLAILKICGRLWNKHRAEGLSSERLGDYSYSLKEGKIIDMDVESLLLPYRKLNI